MVVCLHSGSLATDVVSKAVDKLENHGDSNLDRVVYPSVITSAVTIASVVIVDSLFVTASGGMIILVAVGKCSILEVLPWDADVNRIWSGLEVHVIALVENRLSLEFIDVGPDSDVIDVETDLVESKGSILSPPIDVLLVYSDSVVVDGSIVSTIVGLKVTPGINVVCVV